ncbi:hypothetical protein HID58_010593 [Brassica napus]|uniref:RING-type domain-containing protein n=1 Tax=Brassica napus TaxID=3708 RepID=A0ABQ8DVW8_BRANA|nr:hypothetical protein HID58_010593 [Brassica napus]
MGLPTDFKELQIPGYVLKTLYVIGFFRDLVDALCPYISLPRFLDHEIPRPDPIRPETFTTVSLADKISPVVRFSDIQTDLEDCCTVCLSDFESDDNIRQLPNCRHVFHDHCLDRWIVDCRKMTCPICRDRKQDSAASPPATGPAGRQPAPAPAVPAPVPDLLGDLMGLDNAAIVPVDEPTTSSGPPLPIVVPASTGQGLQISAQLTRRIGQVFYSMLFENNTQVVVDGFMIQFNENTFGLAAAGPLQIVPLQPGTSASTMLPTVVLQNMPAGPPSSLLQAAVKNNQQPTWRSLPDSNEVQREFPGITITSVESTIYLLAAFNMFLIAKRKNGNQDVIY